MRHKERLFSTHPDTISRFGCTLRGHEAPCSSRMNCRYRSLARSSFDVDQSLGRELAVASWDTPTGPPAPALRRRAMDILTICPGGNFCELVPSSWHWIMPPVMFLLLLIVLGVPIAHVLHRSGRSRFLGVCFQPMAEAGPSSGTFGGLGDGTTEYMIGHGELDRIKQFVRRAGFPTMPKD
jgi:hypothetical protein